jgi:Taurine catabolism dioxygenase TauD, TfdA family
MDAEIRQLRPLFVGEVSGMDLSQPVDAASVRAIWEAIDRYAVLVFHDQQLSDEQLRDFAGKFGQLEIGRSATEGGKRRLALPEIGDISNSTRVASCATAMTAGASTASATAFGIPMPPICRCLWYSGCCTRSQCRRQARSGVARLNSPICAPLTTRCRRSCRMRSTDSSPSMISSGRVVRSASPISYPVSARNIRPHSSGW